jgi:hypothetical protein
VAEYNDYAQLKIGPSVVGLVALEDLQYDGSDANCRMPKTSFQEATAFEKKADANIKKLGDPIIIWRFTDYVPKTAALALRAHLSAGDMSGEVYIASPDQDGDMQNWKTIMNWPTEPLEYVAFEGFAGLELVFTRCEVQ